MPLWKDKKTTKFFLGIKMFIFLILFLVSSVATAESPLEKLEGITEEERIEFPEEDIFVKKKEVKPPEPEIKKSIEPKKPEVKQAIKRAEPEKEAVKLPEPEKKEVAKPLESPPVPEKTKEIIKPPVVPEPLFVFPVSLSFSPESLHSLSIYRFQEDYFLGLNVELYSTQYKPFEDYFKKYLKFKPILGFSIVHNFKEKYALILSVKNKFSFKKHGVSVKLTTLYNKDKNRFLNSGVVSALYNYSFISVLKPYDLLTVYVGWKSPHIALDFEDLNFIKGQAADLLSQSKNATLGLYYNPSVFKTLSFGLEADFNQSFMFSAYKGIK